MDTDARESEFSRMTTLDRLVGTWAISGGVKGQIRFEWLEGRHFLMQHVELEYGGRKISGIEMIGHLHQPGAQPTVDIYSRFYSFLDGLTLDYVYELRGDTLRIWYGPKGSTNYFEGRFDADGNSFRGSWHWPSGGYDVVARRIK
jgi:hypothetical protein